ncbi:PRC and DUF2382 domain-containing protein [Streptomyces sp. ACA25]|uniref:PRC and DUF2382 domain-containing protein n=1 Tax=Streptomyces sp. ACA25 TaxID=3022596 RepID=UPI0023070E7A|nr:PRC and DUF2382 domain-containing protein [Streptomyces sp. ACA25]MDB1089820.1 PRC and DUF2382 domain-containing protein [Streptomyces sp. ACA25]
MITTEQIPAVLEHPVYDAEGSKIGEAKQVFLDDATGQPEWASVRTGLFGSKESFLPLRDATLVEDHLEVPIAKETVKDSPQVEVDDEGHMSEEEERRLFQHYGMDWDTSWREANEPGAGWADEKQGETGRAAAPTAETGKRGKRGGHDDAMTRSEEKLHTGVERREAGRARLRKYVVTEEVQQTVPVRREEVRVEREPITEENIDAATSGTEITEAEHEVTLHEERPVTHVEAEPVERVRLNVDEVTEEETVKGQVRKERIEGETPDDER